MTDKQIIIDGCDVSGCEYYCERYCKQVVDEDGCYVFLCAEDANCHYKKWQRKEQECEELKKQHQADKGLITSTGKMNYQLLQEYDKLKAENEELKKWLPITTRLVDEFENYEKIKGINYRIYTQVFFKKFNKLKQTLTEIKEICNNNDELKGDFNLVDCDKYKLGKHNLANKILQKISECEVE
jgi:6-phosphogluconolactonase/glucosamine-6-phosphate isomerase/deaminase